ncbi:hypothetical protein CPC08DRAFT_444584 [Agrocybe pediades]|nr:hypothetical protein CPC08DRAFT_444584 [Agrocybe pediades]
MHNITASFPSFIPSILPLFLHLRLLPFPLHHASAYTNHVVFFLYLYIAWLQSSTFIQTSISRSSDSSSPFCIHRDTTLINHALSSSPSSQSKLYTCKPRCADPYCHRCFIIIMIVDEYELIRLRARRSLLYLYDGQRMPANHER